MNGYAAAELCDCQLKPIGHLDVGPTITRRQHDPRPHRQPRRTAPPPRPTLQLGLVRRSVNTIRGACGDGTPHSNKLD